MAYTLTQAAKPTGKSKSTLRRAIQCHEISATRDQLIRGWLIEAAELYQVSRASFIPAEGCGYDRLLSQEGVGSNNPRGRLNEMPSRVFGGSIRSPNHLCGSRR